MCANVYVEFNRIYRLSIICVNREVKE